MSTPFPQEGRTYPLLWFGTLDSLENSGTPARMGVLGKRVTSVLICMGHLQQNVFQSDPHLPKWGAQQSINTRKNMLELYFSNLLKISLLAYIL